MKSHGETLMLGFLVGLILGIIITGVLAFVVWTIINSDWSGDDGEEDDGFAAPEPPKDPPPTGGGPDRKPKVPKQLKDAIAERLGLERPEEKNDDEEEEEQLQPVC